MNKASLRITWQTNGRPVVPDPLMEVLQGFRYTPPAEIALRTAGITVTFDLPTLGHREMALIASLESFRAQRVTSLPELTFQVSGPK